MCRGGTEIRNGWYHERQTSHSQSEKCDAVRLGVRRSGSNRHVTVNGSLLQNLKVVKIMTKARFFESGEGFRAWLEERHASESELLLGFYKKELARGISYAEALDAALAFGWIDGVRKRLNAEAYTIRFTPRKARSIWSAVNIKRAKELEAAGRMAPAGLRAFRERDEKRAKLYSYERAAKLDPGLAAKLRANRNAAEFFDAQPPGYKRLMSFWVMSAKKEETRERRLSALIAKSAKGKRIDMLKPNPKRH